MTPETHRQLNHLASQPIYGYITMKKKDAQAMLLETDGSMLACGRLWNFVVKDIGAGVCRISLTLTHP